MRAGWGGADNPRCMGVKVEYGAWGRCDEANLHAPAGSVGAGALGPLLHVQIGRWQSGVVFVDLGERATDGSIGNTGRQYGTFRFCCGHLHGLAMIVTPFGSWGTKLAEETSGGSPTAERTGGGGYPCGRLQKFQPVLLRSGSPGEEDLR